MPAWLSAHPPSVSSKQKIESKNADMNADSLADFKLVRCGCCIVNFYWQVLNHWTILLDHIVSFTCETLLA